MSDQIFMKDARGLDVFRVTKTSLPEDTTGFSATVESVSGWDVDTDAPADFEPYLKCLIKWDSCSHFYFGEDPEDGDGYIHMCGVRSYKEHIALVEFLYRLAFGQFGMNRLPMDGEEW